MAYASPATVSRAGMVYVDPKNLGFTPYWQRWVKSRHPDEEETLEQLFTQFLPTSIEYIIEGVDGSSQEDPLSTVILQTSLNMITQLCYMYDALLPLHSSNDDDDDNQQQPDTVINTDVVCAIFLLVRQYSFLYTIYLVYLIH